MKTLGPTGADTLATALARRAGEEPDRVAIAFASADAATRRITYGSFSERVALAAGLLQRFGVERGTTVNVHLANCVEFLEFWFACAHLGALMVPTNPQLTVPELEYVLKHGRCALTVTSIPAWSTVQKAANVPKLLIGSEERPGAVLVEDALTDAKPAALADVATGDAASVMYTSGTTSRPKGVVVSHAAYLHAGEVVAQHLRMRPDDRTLIVLPLFHANAQNYSTMAAFVTGASIALAERFSASRWSAQAELLEATIGSLFAAPMRMILAQPASDADQRHRLRTVMFAQNLTEQQLVEFEDRFGVTLVQLYGMTETVAPVTLNAVYGPRRNMTIGRPMPWARVQVVDADGNAVTAGSVGEMLVGGEPGATVFSNYFQDPEATHSAWCDGWFRTGDVVRVEPDGFLSFVDRNRDMIKRGGENVSLGEVEGVLNQHPAIMETACIGVNDAVRDQAIRAFVVTNRAHVEEEELASWCRARLAAFKVPTEFVFVSELPRTAVGKVQKHVLAASTVAPSDSHR